MQISDFMNPKRIKIREINKKTETCLQVSVSYFLFVVCRFFALGDPKRIKKKECRKLDTLNVCKIFSRCMQISDFMNPKRIKIREINKKTETCLQVSVSYFLFVVCRFFALGDPKRIKIRELGRIKRKRCALRTKN